MKVDALIYLDTRDYSDIWNARKRGELSQVETAVNALREAGARFCFSSASVVEFVTRPGPGYEDAHADRGALISEITDGLSLSYHSERDADTPFLSDTAWLPAPILKLTEPNHLRKTAVLDAIEATRKLSVVPSGGNSDLSDLQKALRAEGLSSEWVEIPGSAFLPPAMRRLRVREKLMLGEIDEFEATRRYRSFLADPENFSPVQYVWFAKVDYRLRWQEAGEGMCEAIKDQRARKRTYQAARKELRSLRNELFKDGMSKDEVNEIAPQIPAWSRSVTDLFPDGLISPREDHFFDFVVGMIEGVKVAEPSDYLDLVHLTYAPDVDFISVDKRTERLFRGNNLFGEKLFTSVQLLADQLIN